MPRYVTVFRSRLRPGIDAAYNARGEEIYNLAVTMPGFISIKDFTADDGERVAIVEFESAETLAAWRDHPEHRLAQQQGREHWYSHYSIQVCVVERATSFEWSAS
jgi:heme-degrading monooxygenase HmoA